MSAGPFDLVGWSAAIGAMAGQRAHRVVNCRGLWSRSRRGARRSIHGRGRLMMWLRVGAAFLAKERAEDHKEPDHDKNAGPPVVVAFGEDETQNDEPDPAAFAGVKERRSVAKSFMFMHAANPLCDRWRRIPGYT